MKAHMRPPFMSVFGHRPLAQYALYAKVLSKIDVPDSKVTWSCNGRNGDARKRSSHLYARCHQWSATIHTSSFVILGCLTVKAGLINTTLFKTFLSQPFSS